MSDKIITKLTDKELLAVYNQMSKSEAKKFRDRQLGIAKVHGLALNNEAGLLKAMKAAKVKPERIAEYEKELAASKLAAESAQAKAKLPVPTPEKTPDKPKKGTKTGAEKGEKTPRNPVKSGSRQQEATEPGPADPDKAPSVPTPTVIDPSDPWSVASSPLLDSQAEEKAKLGPIPSIAKPKQRPNRIPEALLVGSKAAAYLWHLQFIMKGLATKNQDQVTTGQALAQRAKTTNKDACRQIEILQALGHVEVEDDTEPGAKEPYLYVTLTTKGKGWIIPAGADGLPVINDLEEKPERTVREPRAPKAPRVPGANPGPRSSDAGKKIHKLVKDNPRREGSIGHHSFSLIKDGMTYEEYIALGGRAGDIKWDVEHGFIELEF